MGIFLHPALLFLWWSVGGPQRAVSENFHTGRKSELLSSWRKENRSPPPMLIIRKVTFCTGTFQEVKTRI